MIKKFCYICLLLCVSQIGFAQESLSELLDQFNNESIPYMTVEQLEKEKGIVIFDAREKREYDVSHLKNAIYVGYESFDLNVIKNKFDNKDQKIIVYCTLGIRSEDIAEQLKAAGYSNVFNLFGGIFEWKNNGLPILDNTNSETENVHVCSKFWSKWLVKGIKIYE
jgi:rhodanese-related sulfurtransferase